MNTLKNHFKEQLKRSGKKCTVNNNICSVCFFKEIKDKENIDTKYMFIDKDVNVMQGDIIESLNQKWIVVQQQENYNNVYSIYTVRRLNNKLNFQFADGVYSIDCIVEDSIQSITGVDIPLADGRIQVITQSNNITKYLEEGIKFILYGRAWEIESYTQTEKNIIKFYCKKGQIKTNIDDVENNIAYNEKLLKIFINSKYEIAITGDSNFDLKEGESKVINIEFKKNNIIDTAPVVQYIYDKDLVKFDKDTKTITGLQVGNTDFKIIYNNVEKIIKVNVEKIMYKISVSNSIKINQGETINIDAKFIKNGIEDINAKVTYISNNPSISSIDDKGKIIAKNVGTTTITIKYNNVEKIIKVNVGKINYNIEVTQNDYNLNKNETATINAKFYKDNVEDTSPVVEYISNDRNIATVDKGIITGVGAGTTTITIKYNNVEKVINVIVEEVSTGLKIIGEDTHKVGRLQQYSIQNPTGKDIKCTLNVGSDIAKIRETTNTSVMILATRNHSNVNKKFTIRVELADDKNVFDEKEITLKPQF